MENKSQFGLNDSTEIKEEIEDSAFYENEFHSLKNTKGKHMDSNFDTMNIGVSQSPFSLSLTEAINSLVDNDFDYDTKPLFDHSDSLLPLSSHSWDNHDKTPTMDSTVSKFPFPEHHHPPFTGLQKSSNCFPTHQTETNLFEKAIKLFPSTCTSGRDSSENLFMKNIHGDFAIPKKCLGSNIHNLDSRPSPSESQGNVSEISQEIPLQMCGHKLSSCGKNLSSHLDEQSSSCFPKSQHVTCSSSFSQDVSKVFQSSSTCSRSTDDTARINIRPNLFQLGSHQECASTEFVADSHERRQSDATKRVNKKTSFLKPHSFTNPDTDSKLEKTNEQNASVKKRQPVKPIFKPVFKKPRKMPEKNACENSSTKVGTKVCSEIKARALNISNCKQNNTSHGTLCINSKPLQDDTNIDITSNSLKSSNNDIISGSIKEEILSQEAKEGRDSANYVTNEILTTATNEASLQIEASHNLPIHAQLKAKIHKMKTKSSKNQTDTNTCKQNASHNNIKSCLKTAQNFKDKFPALYCQGSQTETKAPLLSLTKQKNTNLGKKKHNIIKHSEDGDTTGQAEKTTIEVAKQSGKKSNKSKATMHTQSPNEISVSKSVICNTSENKEVLPSSQNTFLMTKTSCSFEAEFSSNDVTEDLTSIVPHHLSFEGKESDTIEKLNTNSMARSSEDLTDNRKDSVVTSSQVSHGNTTPLNEEQIVAESFCLASDSPKLKGHRRSSILGSRKCKKTKLRPKASSQSSLISGSPFIASRKVKAFKKLKTNDPRLRSMKERLYKLQDETRFPVWVQCDACRKWRCLKNVEDPATLPREWTCLLNSDASAASCDAAEESFDQDNHDEIFVYNRYTLGSVVWVTNFGPEWWPAMVDDDPNTDTFFWLPESSNVPNYYHVTFFGPEVSRAWVRSTCVVSFKDHGVRHSKAAIKKRREATEAAVAEAKMALTLPLEDRRRIYCFATRFKGRWFTDSILGVQDGQVA